MNAFHPSRYCAKYRAYHMATGLITICTAPLRRAWPKTNINSPTLSGQPAGVHGLQYVNTVFLEQNSVVIKHFVTGLWRHSPKPRYRHLPPAA